MDQNATKTTTEVLVVAPKLSAPIAPNKYVTVIGDVVSFDTLPGSDDVYNAKTGVALLTGNVKLTRGRNQANGDFLEINLNSGLYKLGCRPGTGSNCVRGLFVPEKQGGGSARP